MQTGRDRFMIFFNLLLYYKCSFRLAMRSGERRFSGITEGEVDLSVLCRLVTGLYRLYTVFDAYNCLETSETYMSGKCHMILKESKINLLSL